MAPRARIQLKTPDVLECAVLGCLKTDCDDRTDILDKLMIYVKLSRVLCSRRKEGHPLHEAGDRE